MFAVYCFLILFVINDDQTCVFAKLGQRSVIHFKTTFSGARIIGNPEVYTDALLMLPMALNCLHATSRMCAVRLLACDIQVCLLRRHLKRGLPWATCKLTPQHGVILKTLIVTIKKKPPDLWTLMVHDSVHNSSPLVPSHNRMNPVCTLACCLFSIHRHITILSMPMSVTGFEQNSTLTWQQIITRLNSARSRPKYRSVYHK